MKVDSVAIPAELGLKSVAPHNLRLGTAPAD
jgi:hypothetical protein